MTTAYMIGSILLAVGQILPAIALVLADVMRQRLDKVNNETP